MNAHFAIFVINIQRTMGEGVVTGGYNCPALHTLNSILLVALFRLRNISIVDCCVIFNCKDTEVGARGGTPIHYLYGYVPPNGVVILKLLI